MWDALRHLLDKHGYWPFILAALLLMTIPPILIHRATRERPAERSEPVMRPTPMEPVRKPSDQSKRLPLDPRLVGKWTYKGSMRFGWADYSDRSLVFTAGGKFVYTASGIRYDNNASFWKKGDNAITSYSGTCWLLEGGRIELVGGSESPLIMGIDWITNDELVLAEADDIGSRNRDMAHYLIGTPVRSK